MTNIVCFILIYVLYPMCADSARILGVVLTPSISHQTVFRPLWKELSLRGHQVVVLTTDPIHDSTFENLTEIDLHFSYKIWNSNMEPHLSKPKNIKFMIDLTVATINKVVDQQLSHTDVRQLLNDEKQHFDLVISEIVIPIAAAFSERFKCPYIGALSFDASTHFYNMIGNPINPITNPDLNLPYVGKLTFFQRIKSVLYNFIAKYVGQVHIRDMEVIIKKHFGKDSPSLEQILNKMNLLFTNSNFALNQKIALMPNVIQIGVGIHRHPSKPLREDLQNYLDGATEGFIYFSLGTNVKSRNLSKRAKQILLETFEELPYKVLWKFELENLTGTSDNLIISKWFPQQDIFKHPNLKLFITQGGIQSIEEATLDHIPMIGIPFFMDQPNNVRRMVANGLGLSLDYKNLTKQALKEMILEVINNPRYRERAIELSVLAQDQPMTGLEKAIWWTEYVIRHKGARHLKSPFLNVPVYQYYLLDVTGLCLFVIIFILVFLMILLKTIYRLLRTWLQVKIKSKTA